jgi:glycosyltransferase involved in cell wall biosynthesis
VRAMGLATVIPAFNEAATIAAVVAGVRAACPTAAVLVVDDASTDETVVRAAAAGASAVLRMSTRAGKGAALRLGFAAALAEGAELVATLDADGQHDPADLPRLLAAGRSAPDGLIMGDRLAPGSGDRIPGLRLGAIRAADVVLRWLARTAIRDSQCGFRLYPATLLRALPLYREGFVLETEALLGAARLGYRLVSVPVRAIYPPDRTSRFRAVADGTRIGWYLAGEVTRELPGRSVTDPSRRRLRQPVVAPPA